MFRSVKPLFFSHPQWVDEAPFFSPCATQFTAVQGVTGMTWLQLEQIVQVSDFFGNLMGVTTRGSNKIPTTKTVSTLR